MQFKVKGQDKTFFTKENFLFHIEIGSSKGQLISKCLFEKIVWTKIPPKNLIDSAHKLSGQNLSNFSVVFWSKRFFQKDILKLTDL